MNLKNLRRTLSEMRYFKHLVRHYGKSLYAGKYQLFPSMRAIALEKEETIKYAEGYFNKRNGKSKTVALINRVNKLGYYRNRKKSELDKYEAIYSANNYDKVREVKLFSFERKRILTVCTSREKCDGQLSEYDTLHEYFGMPRVKETDLYPNAYEISMVALLPRPAESEALGEIARCTSLYHGAHSSGSYRLVSDILVAEYADAALNEPLQSIASEIGEDFCSLNLPLCFQHGDLSRDNLIYGKCDGKDGFYWIDWEHARERIFFYDYFFYILNTAVYFSDNAALDAYLSGACDVHLDAFFKAFGMNYEKDRKKEYFMIFAIDFLRQRVADLGNVSALGMYVDFINQIKFE